MPVIPLSLANSITQAQGTDLIAADQAILAAIGTLSNPDANAVTSKLTSLLSAVGNKTLADSLINFLSLIRSTLGASGDTPAASPTATANIIPILKLISKYLQQSNSKSTTATQVVTAVGLASGPAIAAGDKTLWTVGNFTSATIWLGYGKVAVVNSGFPIYPNTCWVDEFDFGGIVNAIGTSAVNAEVTVFTA